MTAACTPPLRPSTIMFSAMTCGFACCRAGVQGAPRQQRQIPDGGEEKLTTNGLLRLPDCDLRPSPRGRVYSRLLHRMRRERCEAMHFPH